MTAPTSKGDMMNDADVLITDKEKVKIGDREYSVGELSMRQLIKLSKFVAKIIFSSKDKLDELAKDTAETTDNMQDVLKIIELIDEEKLPELFGIILKESDLDFLKDISPVQTSEILAILCEKNNFIQLKKNIQRIIAVIKPIGNQETT